MLARTASARDLTLVLTLSAALGATAGAQSNVRPAPGVARAPAVGARYLAEPNPWLRPVTEGSNNPFASPFETLSAVPEMAARQSFTRLELSGHVLPETGFEGGTGAVSTTRGGWEAIMGERIDDEVVFAVDLEAEASFYDFSSAGALQAGSADPFNDVYDSRLGLSIMESPGSAIGWFSGAQLRLSGEDDVDLADSLSVGVVGGLRRELDDDLSLSLGVAALSRLEDTPWVFPYIGFDWRVADWLRLVSHGSQVAAVFECGQDVELSLGADYAIRQFRLNDDSPLPSGVVQDEEILAGLGLDWTPSERFTLQLEAGVALWRELQSYDSGGAKLAEIETDPTEFVSLTLSVIF